ncbi:fumarylacetoacetate hydrolase family protein [Hyphococcus sp.]|uniref:fumarylacetoacetate hydrolase family protein n=1 Tax=Hyphococcus sp. TaxID=2038636 RepID=UPI0035C69B32
MKLATIVMDGRRVGVFEYAPGKLVSLSALDLGCDSVRHFIELGDEALAAAQNYETERDEDLINAGNAEWAAVIPDPTKILCIALNNSAADSQLTYRPDFPVYFPKLPSALTGHLQAVDLYPHYGLVHPEPEVAVIIGKQARNVSIDEAMEHVFGYTIFNDITSVGMRKEDRFVAEYPIPDGKGGFTPTTEHVVYQGRYKSADGFAPMGPYIVHKKDVPDPMKLRVRCWLDDDVLMDDNTSAYHFSIPEVICWISQHATLQPGDVIPLGTALHPDEHRRPISYGNLNKFGDKVTIEIETLGRLESPIRRVDALDPRTSFASAK